VFFIDKCHWPQSKNMCIVHDVKATQTTTSISLDLPRRGLASNLVCLASASSSLSLLLPCLASVRDINCCLASPLPRPLCLDLCLCLDKTALCPSMLIWLTMTQWMYSTPATKIEVKTKNRALPTVLSRMAHPGTRWNWSTRQQRAHVQREASVSLVLHCQAFSDQM